MVSRAARSSTTNPTSSRQSLLIHNSSHIPAIAPSLARVCWAGITLYISRIEAGLTRHSLPFGKLKTLSTPLPATLHKVHTVSIIRETV